MCKEFSGPHAVFPAVTSFIVVVGEVHWFAAKFSEALSVLGDAAGSMGVVSNKSPNQSSQGGTISGKAVAAPPLQVGESLHDPWWWHQIVIPKS